MIPILFEKLFPDVSIPYYQTEGSAGMDVKAAEYASLAPGAYKGIRTGLRVQIPEGYEIQCRSRSGLALNHGIMVLNSPGTIDSDYRGEIKVILINHGSMTYEVQAGDRIAQLVVSEIPIVDIYEGKLDDETGRGAGGFGSTGR